MAESYVYALLNFLTTDFRRATEDEVQSVCLELSNAVSKDVRVCIDSSDVQEVLSHDIELLNLADERSSFELFSSALMPLQKIFSFIKREIVPQTSCAEIVSVMLAFLHKNSMYASMYLVTLQSVLDKIKVGFPIDLRCPLDFVLALTFLKNNDSAGTKVARTVVTQLLTHTVPTIEELKACLPCVTVRIRGRTEASPEVCLALAAIGHQALKGSEETAEELARVRVVEELVRLLQHARRTDYLPVYIGSVLLILRLLARHGPPLTERLIACKVLDQMYVFVSSDLRSIRKSAGMIVSYILGYAGLSNPLVPVRKSLVPKPHTMLLSGGEMECQAVTLLLQTFLSSPEWEPWFIDDRLSSDLALVMCWSEEARQTYAKCLKDALERIPDERQLCIVCEKLDKLERGFEIKEPLAFL